MIDKELIKNRFSSRLETYEDASIVQKEVAEKLIQTLLEFGLSEYGRLFEIGAGTGHLSQIIDKKLIVNNLIFNDIAPQSRDFLSDKISGNFEFIEGDAEQVSYPDQLSAIISSSTIQWFEDLPRFFKRAFQALNSKGLLILSTFGTENFQEIREITGLGLDYTSTEDLKEIISEDYNIIYANNWKREMLFDSAIEVFNHIKLTGVNALKKETLDSSSMRRYLQEYEDQYNEDGKVILTYNPIIIIAQKP